MAVEARISPPRNDAKKYFNLLYNVMYITDILQGWTGGSETSTLWLKQPVRASYEKLQNEFIAGSSNEL